MTKLSLKILAILFLFALLGVSYLAISKNGEPLAKSLFLKRTQSGEVTKADLKLISHSNGEMILEFECPEPTIERDEQTGAVTGFEMKGAVLVMETGVPKLCLISQNLDCLPGYVNATILQIEEETVKLGTMMATPPDKIVDERPTDTDADAEQFRASANGILPERNLDSQSDFQANSWRERSLSTPKKQGLWPQNSVETKESGIFRGHRLVTVNFYPIRVDAENGTAKIAKRIKIRVTLPQATDEAMRARMPDRPKETELVRNLLGKALAQTVLPDRMTEAFEGRSENSHGRLDDQPIGGRWKIYLAFEGICVVDGQDLFDNNVPREQISTIDFHLYNRGQEVPIQFVGGDDGRFDEFDYFRFFCQPNLAQANKTSQVMYKDQFTDENVYIMSWGDGIPGLRLSEEDGAFHPEWNSFNNIPLFNVRSKYHFEVDAKFDRLSRSYIEWGSLLARKGPFGTGDDNWFWGVYIDGQTTREFPVQLPFPDTRSPKAVTVRAALQGYTFNAGNRLYQGEHRAIVFLNGNTERGLAVGRTAPNDTATSWRNQAPVIIQSMPLDSFDSGITPQDLAETGSNILSVSLPGDGLDGANDKIYANWFEVEYDRDLRAAEQHLRFPLNYSRRDTFSLDIRGFSHRDIEVWKLGRSRLTSLTTRPVNPAPEPASWAVKFQVPSDDAYDMLVFDGQSYPSHPARIRPEAGTFDLRTYAGAEYVMIVADTLMQDPVAQIALFRLDSLRRASFNNSALMISDQAVYEQFSHGIMHPNGIRDFLKYAYEHWSVRPTHCCLVGDGVMEMKTYGLNYGLIPSFYPITYLFGVASADILFGCVSGPDWDLLPDIAVGRISARAANNATDLVSYVEKVYRYETESDYNSLYRSNFLFVTDVRDQDFNFDLAFSEPAIRQMPDEVNVSRISLDSLIARGESGPSSLRDAFRAGAAVVNYNGHGGGGLWSGTSLMTVQGCRLLRNTRRLPLITAFTCYSGTYDARNQQEVLGEAFLFATNSSNGDEVGGIGVYSSCGVGWANAGARMQSYLFDFISIPPGLTLGELVQINKTRYFAGNGGLTLNINSSDLAMMYMMNLLGDPGVKLTIPQQSFSPQLFAINEDSTDLNNVVNQSDQIRVSGVLPWTPSASGTDIYVLPYNHDHIKALRFPRFGLPDLVVNYRYAHIPAFIPDDVSPQVINLQNFKTQAFDISTSSAPLVSAEGRIVVYVSDVGLKRDAIGAFPIYLADSLRGLGIFDIEATPYATIVTDSVFRVQATVLDTVDIERVRFRGVMRFSSGPFAQDTVEMTEVGPGRWETPELGPYYAAGGRYTARFLVKPVGGEFIQSTLYQIPIQGLPDYSVTQTSMSPGTMAGNFPQYFVPVFNGRGAGAPNVSELTVAAYAQRDSVVGLDTLVADSFTTFTTLYNTAQLPGIMAFYLPLALQQGSYRITSRIDPNSRVPETVETNNSFTHTILANIFPVSNTLGTYLLRPERSEVELAYRGSPALGTDSIRIKINPNSIGEDSSCLVFSTPEIMTLADSARLSSMGLAPLAPNIRPRIFKVQLSDSNETFTETGSAEVTFRTASMLDSLLPQIAVYQKRTASSFWTKLENTTVVREGIRVVIRGTAKGLGKFTVLRSKDARGPVVEFAAAGLRFTEQSILPRRPEIFANLQDAGGISRGAGKFYFILDGDTLPESELTWSDTLQSSGNVSVLIRPELEVGQHSLRVYATDNSGNTGVGTAEFRVLGDFGISWAINYPNPFKNTTTISYLLTDITSDFVEVKIFTVSGRLIRTLRELDRQVANYRALFWDGLDEDGESVANGIYFAKIKAKSDDTEAEKIVKLAKVR